MQACLKIADEGDIAHHEFGAGPGAVFHLEMLVIRIVLDAPVIASPFDAPAAGQKLIAATLEPEIGEARSPRQHRLDILYGDGLALLGEAKILEQAGAVDLVLIPCRPTAFDLAAAGSAVQIVRAAGVRAAFVLSACPFRAPEIVETRHVLETFGFPIAPAVITDRRAFARAVATGRAVTEFESEGKAAEEIRALWTWIKEQLDDE